MSRDSELCPIVWEKVFNVYSLLCINQSLLMVCIIFKDTPTEKIARKHLLPWGVLAISSSSSSDAYVRQ